MTGRAARRHEHGAVAVMVAALSVVLLLVAALSVDLGNAWARQRQVQTQVDVAALAGGYLLPATTPAKRTEVATVVAKYLNKNHVAGQPTVTAADLTDSDTTNGQILFFDRGTTVGAYYEVVVPRTKVNYGLGRVIGRKSTSVTAAATVEIESQLPSKADTIPFWLPTGCPYGAGMADTDSGPSSSVSSATPSSTEVPFTPGPRGNHSTTLNVTSATYGTANVPVTVTIDKIPKGNTGTTIRFTHGANKVVDFTASWAATTSSNSSKTVDISVGTSVTNTPGAWTVWAILGTEYPKTEATFTVGGGPTPTTSPTASATSTTVSCSTSTRGEYGQLDSPRQVEKNQAAFAMNIAVGLDHQIVPFVDAPSNDCGKQNGTPITGGVYDDASKDGNNCILGDTGNDGPSMYDGFIAGTGSVPGRLAIANGVTNPSCGRPDANVKGHLINNDVLSCYLRGGHSLDDIAQDNGVTTDMLDPAVTTSSRFVWIPVVYSPDRSVKDFQPIRRFVPGFITDESRTAKNGSSDATADNGITVNGGSSIKSVQVFMFNKAALPPDLASPDAPAYNADLQSVPRLVN